MYDRSNTPSSKATPNNINRINLEVSPSETDRGRTDHNTYNL
jgi:hypothetical protein